MRNHLDAIIKPGYSHNRRAGVARLIVVAAVVLIVGSLLVSGIIRARESARRQRCFNQMHLVGLKLGNYIDSHSTFPRGTVKNDLLPPESRLSWYVNAWSSLLSYDNILLQIEKDEPWDAEENLSPRWINTDIEENVEANVKVDKATPGWPVDAYIDWQCPSEDPENCLCIPPFTSYVGIAGLGADAPLLQTNNERSGIWGYDRQTSMKQITDGSSSTILLAETAQGIGPWTAGGFSTVRGFAPPSVLPIGPGRQFGGLHQAGANVAFADSSARLLSNDIDPSIFSKMITIAGDENIEPTGNAKHNR